MLKGRKVKGPKCQKLFTNNLGQNQASTWVCINFNSSDHSRANQGIPGYLWLHLEIPSIKYFDFFVNLITPPWTTTPTLVCFGQSNDLIFFPRCCEIYCVLKKLSLWHKNTCTEHFLQIITGNLNMIWPQYLNGPQYATHNLTYGGKYENWHNPKACMKGESNRRKMLS